MNIIEQAGGRKFLFAVGVVLIASGLAFAKILPIEKWVELVEVVGATYVAGNVGSKFFSNTTPKI